MKISNEKIMQHQWLKDMRQDQYFPSFLVDKLAQILLMVCEKIEQQKPSDNNALYQITNEAVDTINHLQQAFEDNESEIETVARDSIGSDFEFIAHTYGYVTIDIEALIANREW